MLKSTFITKEQSILKIFLKEMKKKRKDLFQSLCKQKQLFLFDFFSNSYQWLILVIFYEGIKIVLKCENKNNRPKQKHL